MDHSFLDGREVAMKKHLFAVMAFLALAALALATLACSFSQITSGVTQKKPGEATQVISSGQTGEQSGAQPAVPETQCGDGVCEDEENAQDCPLDCTDVAA